MPDGRLQRLDTNKNVAVIVRRGREFLAPLGEVEPHARVPGARVHFDVSRDNGVDGAQNVRLAVGTRSNRRQRRFGDLTGARRPGAKVKTTAARVLGVDVSTQPVQVVAAWVDVVIEGDSDAAVALYSPDAVVHTDEETITGRLRLRGFLDVNTPRNIEAAEVEVHGADQLVRIDWPPETQFGMAPVSTESTSSWFEVDRGHIIEQWHCVTPDLAPPEAPPSGAIEIVTEGPIDQRDVSTAYERLDKLVASIDAPVGLARMKLSMISHPSDRPLSGTASIDIDGTVVRAHIGTRTTIEAIDALCLRLGRLVEAHTNRHRDKSQSTTKLESWHHGDVPVGRPEFFVRPPDERALVRHKSYTTELSTIDEALWDLFSLDYDFFLFTEETTEQDCVLAATDDQITIRSLDSSVELPHSERVTAINVDAPSLTVSGALGRLDAGGERFVFFRNSVTGRGNIAYLRYDGHAGLITPANEIRE